MGDEELMRCPICCGRGIAQDFVPRSQNINDAIDYLRMERWSEILKMTPFATADLVNFERKTDPPHQAPQAYGIRQTFNVDHSD